MSTLSSLASHVATFFSALATGLGAFLAMLVAFFFALISAPIADFSTKTTDFGRKFSAPSHRANAQLADFRALNTTLRAVTGTRFSQHFGNASLAINDALLTGFDTTLVLTHGFFLYRLGFCVRVQRFKLVFGQ